MIDRPSVETKPWYLISTEVVERACTWIRHMPIDPEHPIEVVVREQIKKRKLTLNQAYWAGTMVDIERDARHGGRQYAAEIWHEMLKEKFLPDEMSKCFDCNWAVDGYQKWGTSPFREYPVLRGSTTQLTDRGMRRYMLQVEAYMSQEYGVTFTTKTEPIGRTKG